MRIFYITVSIILLITVQVKAQSRLSPLSDPDNHLIKFYPNPAISQITFDIQKSSDKIYSIQIFNFIGKKVFEVPSIDQKTIVNVSDFFRGIYIFQLKDQTGKIIESGKFQVNR
jgi:Secretion system C-terminal sorting domain